MGFGGNMPIQMIPHGKGTGKFWLLGIVIVFGFCFMWIGYDQLVEGINNGTITNPLIIFLVGYIFYPLVYLLSQILNLFLKWGVLSVIPITIIVVLIVVGFQNIKDFIIKRRLKHLKNQ